MIHTKIGRDARIGRPGDQTGEILVWPWRFEEIANKTNIPPVPYRRQAQPLLQAKVSILIFSSPDLANLMQVYQALINNPILNVGEQTIRIYPNPLTIEQLTAVFTAADLPLKICLSYSVDTFDQSGTPGLEPRNISATSIPNFMEQEIV